MLTQIPNAQPRARHLCLELEAIHGQKPRQGEGKQSHKLVRLARSYFPLACGSEMKTADVRGRHSKSQKSNTLAKLLQKVSEGANEMAAINEAVAAGVGSGFVLTTWETKEMGRYL